MSMPWEKRQDGTSTLYYRVAQVAAAELQEVFRLTQFTFDLTEADEALVDWLLRPQRSMMVGDVVENDVGRFRCERFGWQRV